MDKKYELLKDDTKQVGIHTLYRIRALINFGSIKVGDLGGYIEKEDNLSHKGICWVYDDAAVFGDATVRDDAAISHYAQVFDSAVVRDNAVVEADARVYGAAHILDYARISGEARVFNDAEVSDNVEIEGETFIYGSAIIQDDAYVCGNARIYGMANVMDNSWVKDHAKIYDNGKVCGTGAVQGNAIIRKDGIVFTNGIVTGDGLIEHPHDIIILPVHQINVPTPQYISMYKDVNGDIMVATNSGEYPVNLFIDEMVDTFYFDNNDDVNKQTLISNLEEAMITLSQQ